MTERAPDFLIAGAPRCGTTAATRYLEQHPDIAMCDPKEPHYLALRTVGLDFRGPGDDHTINARSIGTLSGYAAVLDRARATARYVGDGSVTAMYHWPRVAETLRAELEGEPRIVVMLRNPVDRAYSSYLYQRKHGFETESFAEGLRLEETRIAADFQHMWHYRSCSRYGPQLRRLVESVGRDRVKIVIFEDFQADPLGVANEIGEFVSGRSSVFSEVSSVNRSGEPRSFAVASASAAVRRNPVTRRLVRLVTTKELRARVTSSLVTYPEMDPFLRRDLVDEYAADRSVVAEYIGRSPEEWNR